jgi:hypothetical protein
VAHNGAVQLQRGGQAVYGASKLRLGEVSRWRTLVVAGLVLAVYLAALGHWYRTGHSVRDFVFVGHLFVDNANRNGGDSPAIVNGPVKATTSFGYDGQFYYFIALDPGRAAAYIDDPSYRFQRIAYPLVARAIVLGQRSLVPEGLVAANLVAIVLGVLALGAWLVRRGMPPWPAAIWGLYPGQVVSFDRDLADAFAYGIAAVGIWLRDHSLLGAAAVFGLAALARETTLVFPILFLLADLWAVRHDSRPGAWLRPAAAALLALVPFAIWKLFIQMSHMPGTVPNQAFTLIPFGGVIAGVRHSHALLITIVLPTLICLGALVWLVWRRVWRIEVLLLAVSLLAFIVFLDFPVYEWWPSASRASLAVALSALLVLPLVRARAWFWILGASWLWVSPLWLWHPV